MPGKKDATQAGVSDEEKTLNPDETTPEPEKTTAEIEAEEHEKPQVSRRQEMMDLVAARRDEELAGEIGAPAPVEEEEDEVLKDDKAKPPEKKKPAEKKETPPEPTDEEDELIIDGTKQKVPKSKIYDTGKRALQKELAADKKLEEAGRILTAVQQEAERIKQGDKRPPEGDHPEDAERKAPDLDDPEFDKKVSDWVSKIQYGSEEEGKQALKEVLMQGRGVSTATPVKEEEVVERVEQRLVLKGIRERFEKEFDDVTQDPELYGITVGRINQALKSGKPNSWETYEAVGKAVREKFVRHETVTTEDQTKEPKPINLEQRREKKRSIDAIRPASVRTTTTEPAIENPDVSGTIAQMRKARHQS